MYTDPASNKNHSSIRLTTMRFNINRLRWLVLCSVFSFLIVLPCLSVYQSFVAANAYDLLTPSEKYLYDVMEFITVFLSNPESDLDMLKGTTWSASIFGFKVSDPLAVVAQSAAGLELHWPFIATAIIPVLLTIFLGRIFCGWICPATFLYELNSNVAAWLAKKGWVQGQRHFDRRIKYWLLAFMLLLSMLIGSVLLAAVYPPAIVGREIYYAITQNGFGIGAIFFMITLLFDVLVARRGFCRYLCPGGALYSLLGRYRLLRVKRDVENCNDCHKCTSICEFELDPMRDGFGQECTNCSACIVVCPTDALSFSFSSSDTLVQGPGHIGHKYRLIERINMSKQASNKSVDQANE